MNDFTSIIFQFSYVVRSDELKSTNHPLEETFTSNVGIQSYPLSEINQFKMEKSKEHKYSMWTLQTHYIYKDSLKVFNNFKYTQSIKIKI